MKPRLYRKNGVWSCITWTPYACGYGYSPKAAYDDWVAEKWCRKVLG